MSVPNAPVGAGHVLVIPASCLALRRRDREPRGEARRRRTAGPCRASGRCRDRTASPSRKRHAGRPRPHSAINAAAWSSASSGASRAPERWCRRRLGRSGLDRVDPSSAPGRCGREAEPPGVAETAWPSTGSTSASMLRAVPDSEHEDQRHRRSIPQTELVIADDGSPIRFTFTSVADATANGQAQHVESTRPST